MSPKFYTINIVFVGIVWICLSLGWQMSTWLWLGD